MRRIPVYKKKLYDLYFTTNIIQVFKSRRMILAGHVGFWWEDAGEDHLEDLGVHERIILKWSFKKWDGEGIGQVAGACKCGNEPSGFIKCKEFLD
jgi:hypothetical protein